MLEFRKIAVRIGRTRLCGPVLGLIAATLLLVHLMTSDLYSFGGSGQGYGPLSWPEFSLIMLVVSIGVLCLSRAWRCIRRPTPQAAESEQPSAPRCDNARLVVGGWLILLYGVAFVFIGFLLSTVLFLMIWLVYGGIRNPFKVAYLSVAGTLLPLYLLVKVAYMPLPRGSGPFEVVTIKLYEWLGLF